MKLRYWIFFSLFLSVAPVYGQGYQPLQRNNATVGNLNVTGNLGVDGGATVNGDIRFGAYTLNNVSATTYYVGPGGDDANACTSSDAPCATLQAACNKVPTYYDSNAGQVKVIVQSGYVGAGCRLDGRTEIYGSGGATPISIQGELVASTLAAGPSTSTVTSASNAFYDGAYTTFTATGAGWTANDLRGRFARNETTGDVAVINSNTADTIEIVGWFTTDDIYIGDEFTVLDSGATINSTGLQINSDADIEVMNLRFTGVNTGIQARSATVRNVQCQTLASSFSSCISMPSLGGAESLDAYNVVLVNTGGYVVSAGDTDYISLQGCASYGGSYLIDAQGRVGAFYDYWSSCTSGTCFRFSSLGVGTMAWEHMTGANFCVEFRGHNGLSSGHLNIDGVTCNNPRTYGFSVAGKSTLLIDQIEGVASTGTNTVAKPFFVVNSGAHVKVHSATNFTASGGTDVTINEQQSHNYTLAQLAQQKYLRVGDNVVQVSGGTARTSAQFGPVTVLDPVAPASIPAASAITRGGLVYDATNDRFVGQRGVSGPWSPLVFGMDYACAALTPGQAVYFTSSSAVAAADSTDATKPAEGVVASTPSGSTCEVVSLGTVSSLTGLTPGAQYFLGTGGALTATPPSGAGNVVQIVGRAIDATSLSVSPQPVVQLP